MRNIEIVHNFFDNFENIRESFKTIPLYSEEEYKKRTIINERDRSLLSYAHFPGTRSESLHRTSPFIFNLILKEFFDKINDTGYKNTTMDCCLHLRLKKDNAGEFIHTDPTVTTMIVYLGPTNMASGTAFYSNAEVRSLPHGVRYKDSDKPYFTVPFIQNTAVFFPGNIRHSSLLNFGNNIHDGRLTLNGFVYSLS